MSEATGVSGSEQSENPEMAITYHWLHGQLLPADLADMQTLMLFLTTKRVNLTTEVVERAMSGGWVCVARCEQGRIIGMITITPVHTIQGSFGYVSNFVIHADFQGQGIGPKLHRLALERLNLQRCELTSNPERTQAHHVYQKLGYTKRVTEVFTLDIPSRRT